ncbi:hypothetical protein K501DRAFT_47799 [Backusella circina FSU 941]|nr:hypothetical protein K501DRAFT_47799 [Backusella circina FSU 941]
MYKGNRLFFFFFGSFLAGVSIGIQSEDKSTADQQTQSDQLEFIECGVQSDQLNTSDATVQAQLATGIDANTQHSVDKKDAHVQYEEAEHLSTTAILPVPIVATSDDDAFFDASSGIQSAQKEDVNEYNNTTSSDDVRLLNGSDKTPVTPDHIQARSISDKSEPTPVHERSVHNNAVTSIPALSAESTPIETKDVTETHSIVSTIDGQPTEDLPTKETETLLSHHDDVEPPVKMYTKEEADALIAAAVAAAITKVSASHPKDIAALLSESNILEKKPVILSDHAGIHEEEGEKRNETRERDASVLSATSTASFDDDEDDNELSTGTAIVYSEEPSMEYRSFRNLSTGPSTAFDQDPISTPEKTEAPLPPLPELTMGTTAVFSQEPVVVVDDIPARPSSPPPPALLNKATFSDISPISPSSSRSNKGKSPMASSELETYPDIMASEEDVSQRVVSPTYEKGTITSLSTASSTHDHIQSMHTQYDPETDATNPNMIALITQTMIGDWLWKYTRKTVGNGISENRHQRYFWIHPYTRTLYWSNTAPGLNDHGGKAKSALIENIIAVPDFTAGPPGLPNISLLIQTSHRQLKLTAPTMEKHEIWFEAISHLITRQNNNTNGTMSILNDSMRNRSVSSAASKQHSRLHDLFQSPQSITTGDTSQDEDEDIEDVRMCCNGKHHVSKLEKDHLHRHQYRRRRSNVA